MTPNDFADINAEKSVVGSLLQDSTCMAFLDMLTPEDYTCPEYAAIHQAAMRLRAKRIPVDTQTVLSELPPETHREMLMLMIEAIRYVPTTANAKHYAEIVRERSRRRAIKRICEQTIDSLGTEGADAAADTAMDALRAMAGGTSTRMTAAQVASETYDTLATIAEGKLPSIETPLCDLNTMMAGGLRKGELTILAAYTGQGKSALAQSILKKSAEDGYRGLLISREMSAFQYGLRAFSSICGIDSEKMLQAKKMDQEQWVAISDAAAKFSRLPIEFAFKAATIEDVRREVRSMRSIDLMVVDYIQILRANERFQNDNGRVSYISRILKEIAMDFKIPVLALSQFSRPQKGVVKRPQLSDLRDSGSLEQDADNVWLMWQPSGEQDPDTPDIYDGWYTSAQKQGERFLLLDVAKQRMGKIGTIGIGFSPKKMGFYSLEKGGRSV
ncbi:MAG: hypothetical protein J6K72_08540 [Clostridia bacterium]|nr:hypothetical protein [Clostridia bacterium]